jgi:hypothetical protein
VKKGRPHRVRTQVFERAADPEEFAERALGFTVVLVDASSLIVLSDIGAIAGARLAWRLSTIAAAAAEAGDASEGISLVGAGTTKAFPVESTDKALVSAARKAHLPLISEDRKVLMAAEAADLDCFDVLVALELLSATGALSAGEYVETRSRLLERNAYRGDRLAWAQAVGLAAAKLA